MVAAQLHVHIHPGIDGDDVVVQPPVENLRDRQTSNSTIGNCPSIEAGADPSWGGGGGGGRDSDWDSHLTNY